MVTVVSINIHAIPHAVPHAVPRAIPHVISLSMVDGT